VPAFSVPGFTFDNHIHYYYFVWAIVLLVVASTLAVTRSPFGRTLVAIHSDETAAKTFGIDCAKYKLRVYVLSALYASLAGSLFAHYMGFLAPDDFGVLTSINILVMLYLGGIGTIYGPALGAVFLKVLPEFTYQFQDYELLMNGIILIIVLVFMPKGLFGILTGIKDRVFTRTPS
jgi:branched-chain amino acid transport system permease protein